MRVNHIFAAIIFSAVISTTYIISNQIRKGEPRFFKSIVSGVVGGVTMSITIYAIQQRQDKKKMNSGTSDPE